MVGSAVNRIRGQGGGVLLADVENADRLGRIPQMRFRIAVWILFLAGIVARGTVFVGVHTDGDEVIYQRGSRQGWSTIGT